MLVGHLRPVSDRVEHFETDIEVLLPLSGLVQESLALHRPIPGRHYVVVAAAAELVAKRIWLPATRASSCTEIAR